MGRRSPPVTVLFVRHAVAKDRHQWDDDDELRPLIKRGHDQAAALVDQLHDYAIDRVLSSPSVRCVDTVVPLAAARGLEVGIEDALAEGNGRKAVKLVDRLLEDGADVALCSHGDVIPDVLHAFGLRWDKCAKASTWVLRSRSDATYLSPPA